MFALHTYTTDCIPFDPFQLYNLLDVNKKMFFFFFNIFTVIFRVYCADHTYCTLRFPMCTTAEVIKTCAADKLQLNRATEDLLLVEIKSNGERTIFKDYDVSVPTGMLHQQSKLFESNKNDSSLQYSFMFEWPDIRFAEGPHRCVGRKKYKKTIFLIRRMNVLPILQFTLTLIRHHCRNKRVPQMELIWTWKR